ncbi:hypothetical protein H3Z83_07940 [Tenacibaculum sp. S7007]|uniref:Uncharacterized protein n=1 Tax=Tenacibaculum pelagium TaxID=2759527 RepID=A0A839AQD2_9FLAO|nr:hypothetical protein [Tenacibaculum pelagium]MBA6156439.1 hypothetical protein [Tenacibaculum pelagium]
MNYKRIEIIFLGIVSLISLVLSQSVIIYKTEYIGLFGLDQNAPFISIVLIVGISFIMFNHLILKISVFKNFFYSLVGITLTYIFAKIIFGIIIGFFVRLDNGKTPLGWEFQYMWSVIPIMTGLLIILTKFYGKRLKKPVKKNV